MFKENINTACPFCRSLRIVKHGTTSTHTPRYRCACCHKTWVQGNIAKTKPDLGTLTEAYLNGYSYRGLHSIYPGSPTRINQKIRKYLFNCLSWEEYFDVCVSNRENRLIHLAVKKFKCIMGDAKGHSMYLAVAIDIFSTVVLGFELGADDSAEIWIKLLERLNRRGFTNPTFMSYGFKTIEDAIKVVYPGSVAFSNFTQSYYDRQLKRELYYMPDISNVILSVMNIYKANRSVWFNNYIDIFRDIRIRQLATDFKDQLINRLHERLNQKSAVRFEGLLKAFQKRFEKFHMIKNDPMPIVNGWIAMCMLSRQGTGFSRLSLYLQRPYETNFKNLYCGKLPEPLILSSESPEMRTFRIELAVRALQMPVRM